jgi:hypothetical protein
MEAEIADLADLREENERLRNDSERLRNRITSMHDVIDFEKVLNERLRANAIVWHKWPENEAPEQVRCLAKDVNGSVYIGEYLPTRGMSDWLLDGFDWRDPAVIVAYAEIPGPEGK